MSLTTLFYLALIEPRLALEEILRRFQAIYLIPAFFCLVLAQIGLAVSGHLVNKAPLNGAGFFFEILGSGITGLTEIIVIGLIVHALVSGGEGLATFFRLLVCICFCQLPLVFLPCFSILEKALEVYTNEVLALTLYMVFSFGLAIYIIHLLAFSIQQAYALKTWIRAFGALAVAIFIMLVLFASGSLGLGFTLASALMNSF
jgi:hypothetical protein